MTDLVLHKVIDNYGVLKLKLVRVGPKVVSEGVLKLERVQVTCPACGQQVEAVATDGRVKGYCAVAKQYVDFPITPGIAAPKAALKGSHLTAEHKAKISAALTRYNSTRAKAAHPTAETRAKLSASAKNLWQEPEHQAKLSSAMKKCWQDPEYRAKQIATHTGKHLTAGTRAKISAALKIKHGNLSP